MSTSSDIFNSFNKVIRKRVPKWNVTFKGDSKLHRFLCWLPPLLFMRATYMRKFWTTIGFTAAYPEGADNDWESLAHEGVHGIQSSKWTRPLFGYLYLFPQSFLIPLGIILALTISPYFWLLALLGAAPLPAPFRTGWELEAYKLSAMIETWRWGVEEALDYVNRLRCIYFRGPSYYFMWPFSFWVRRELETAVAEAAAWGKRLPDGSYIDDIYREMLAAGRVWPEMRPPKE